MSKKIIEIKNITKIYDTGAVQVPALRGISFHVEEGEFVAIMGPSGSGKSTLLNIISCMDKPTDGEYFLNGQDVSKLTRDQLAKVRNKTIGIVFQNFNLLARTNALSNVELPLLYDSEADFKKRHDYAMQALKEVKLGDWWHHTPNQLSGGQQQRVAIARAIVNQPPVLLADEPTGNLDSKSSIELVELLQELNTERKITVIIVTHEYDISQYAQRVITFHDGLIVKDVKVKKRLVAAEVLKKAKTEKHKNNMRELR